MRIVAFPSVIVLSVAVPLVGATHPSSATRVVDRGEKLALVVRGSSNMELPHSAPLNIKWGIKNVSGSEYLLTRGGMRRAGATIRVAGPEGEEFEHRPRDMLAMVRMDQRLERMRNRGNYSGTADTESKERNGSARGVGQVSPAPSGGWRMKDEEIDWRNTVIFYRVLREENRDGVSANEQAVFRNSGECRVVLTFKFRNTRLKHEFTVKVNSPKSKRSSAAIAQLKDEWLMRYVQVGRRGLRRWDGANQSRIKKVEKSLRMFLGEFGETAYGRAVRDALTEVGDGGQGGRPAKTGSKPKDNPEAALHRVFRELRNQRYPLARIQKKLDAEKTEAARQFYEDRGKLLMKFVRGGLAEREFWRKRAKLFRQYVVENHNPLSKIEWKTYRRQLKGGKDEGS